ncbi:MAG: hypothetical protein ACTSXJ_10390 [Candidatus Baldrarchaeia archaeon]
MSTSEEIKRAAIMAADQVFRWFARAMRYILDKYGEEALKGLEEEFRKMGREIAPRVAQAFKIEERDATAMTKVIDLTDDSIGIEGEWEEFSPARAVKIEKKCPVARAIRRAPEICTNLFAAYITGLYEGLGVNAKCSIPKAIARGDPVCEIIIEMQEEEE